MHLIVYILRLQLIYFIPICVIIHTLIFFLHFSQINYANGIEVHLITFFYPNDARWWWLINFHHFMALIFHILLCCNTASISPGNNCLCTRSYNNFPVWKSVNFPLSFYSSSSSAAAAAYERCNWIHFKEELILKLRVEM